MASNADVAPTLLTLMQWPDVPQAFLGYDAFARREPVLVPHFQIDYPTSANQVPLVSTQNPIEEFLLPSLIKFDRLAPSPSDRSLREQRIVRRGTIGP